MSCNGFAPPNVDSATRASTSVGHVESVPTGPSIDAFRSGPTCGTIVYMSSESLRTVRDRFSEFIERVQAHHERVVVTRNGTPAAVLISPEDLESLEETLAVLGDSEALADLVEAHRAYLAGDVVRGVDDVRALRPR